MRTVPANLQTELDKDLGPEIVIAMEVFWTGPNGSSKFYADKAIPGTPLQNKILNQSGLDQAVLVSGGGQSQSISVTLDDTDGEIKGIFDTANVHKVPVRIWLYAVGTSWETDKLSIFFGQINSPVEWLDGSREFNLSVVNAIEDVKIGFSAEEGDFPHLPEDLIGQPWPLCFGTTINVPALKAVPAISGQLATGVGIKDFTLPTRIALAEKITCPQTPVGYKCFTHSVGVQYNAECTMAYEEDQACLQARCYELERLKLRLTEESAYEYNTITIFGGENFPQGRTITLNINGGRFTGKFQGTPQNPSQEFRISSRKHPRDNGQNQLIQEDTLETEVKSKCPSAATDSDDSDFTDTSFGAVFTGLRQSRLTWEAYRAQESAGFFWAAGGQTVTLDSVKEIVYIANIVPSTIKRVSAWRTINGNQFLLTVPKSFYTVRQTNFNGYQVMEVVFQRPLSSEQDSTGGGWSDDIYISQVSSVGPNTVDILEWIINTYTSYSIDSASFAATKTKIDNYPMHFPLLRRVGLLEILQDLARKARCALWLTDDTFYIKYLSEDPTTVASIGMSDIMTDNDDLSTLSIELTKTEELVTELTSEWQKDYSLPKPNKLILRSNVKLYGSHDSTEDYYPYSHIDLVRKSSTFWMIRKANTWKRIKFSTNLKFLKLEPFDAISLTIPSVANGTFKGVVEKAVYDSEQQRINFTIWTPIRAGEMTPYDFAFPAEISENALFPNLQAKQLGHAGSGKEPNFTVVAPPGHPLNVTTSGVYQNVALACNGQSVTSFVSGDCRQDFGDSFPSDVNDTKPGVNIFEDSTEQVSGGTSPVSTGGTGFWSETRQLKDQTTKTESDAGKSRENAQQTRNASNTDAPVTKEDDDFEEFLKNLPPPEELDPEKEPCQVAVIISGFLTKPIRTGGKDVCVPASSSFSETLVFNSFSAAQEFCENFYNGSGNKPPCVRITTCVLSVVVGGAQCEPEGPPRLIGYSPGDDGKSFMY